MRTAALFILSIFCVLTLEVDAQAVYQGPPAPADAVIYEVDVQHFSPEGNLNGVTERLENIKALGANVVYLMPIYPVGEFKAFGSPYCISDYTAVNKKMGTLADLQSLVSAAHQKNMAVILDWVANHTSFDNPWLANEGWYLRDKAGNALSPPGKGWKDVAQLNFDNKDMQAAMIDVMQYWVVNAGIDGYRCDYADGPPVDFWKRAIAQTRKAAGRNLLFLAESGTRDLYKAGFDILSGFDYYNTLKQVYQQNRSVKAIDGVSAQDEGKAVTGYISNHDLVGADGPVSKVFGDNKGAMAAFVVTTLMQGPPMLYYGQNDAARRNNAAGKTPRPAKNRARTQPVEAPASADAEYQNILALRNSSPALKRGKLSFYSTDDVCVFKKELGRQSVLVICNLRNRPANYTTPSALSRTGWTEAFTGATTRLPGSIALQRYEYLILKSL